MFYNGLFCLLRKLYLENWRFPKRWESQGGCLPREVGSLQREQFRDLGLDENSLKFILTAEELESGKWLEDLALPDCQAPEEEYKRLLAICVGSQHVTFNCQMFD